MNQKQITPIDFVNQSIPPEILEQLRVLGRVQFRPAPTKVSAVSSPGDKLTEDSTSVQDNLSGVLAHVAEMESLADQIEDMIDDLTKDMRIPTNNNTTLQNAVKSLDPSSDGSAITKDVFDKALALIDHAPIMVAMGGYDPVLAALTGNGKLEGKYLNCDEITRGVANTWNTAQTNTYSPEKPILDETSKIADEFEQNLGKMILEILQGFFFNMLWPKYLVEMAIINPLKLMVANPLDGIILFFKDYSKEYGPGGARFKIKSDDCLKAKGPLNKALKKLRCFLLCVPPRKMWDPKKYKPMTDMSECNCDSYNKCPDKNPQDVPVDNDSKLGGMGVLMDSLFSDSPNEPCLDPDDFDATHPGSPEGIGVPPECLKNARIILEAVMADALSPADPTQAGLAGTMSVSSIIKKQV